MADVNYSTPARVAASGLTGSTWTALLAAPTIGFKKVLFWYTGDQDIELSFDGGTTTHGFLPGTNVVGALGTTSGAIDYDGDAKAGAETSAISVRKKNVGGAGTSPTVGFVYAMGVEFKS